MQKHIYRGIVLFIVFIAAILYFGRDIKEEKFESKTVVAMSKTTFPLVELKAEKQYINTLHGYSGNIDANLMRDCITTVDSKQTLSVRIDRKGNKVKKINYELRENSKNTLIDSGSINALEEEEGYIVAKIKFKVQMEQGVEYSSKITLVTDTSKKINYYTKVKFLENAHLKEKLSFIETFHKATLSKKKMKDISSYLEPNGTEDDTSLAHVTIHSKQDLISWAELKPTIVSDIVTTLKEINYETASVELAYTASAETASGEEFFNVKEFYRVKWTESRMYLLSYDRTIETVFDINNISLTKNELKIGITNETNPEIVSNEEKNKIGFVRGRELWYYDLTENTATEVFNFTQQDTDYIRDTYDQHSIKILNIEEDGNLDFIVYGYMNRGDYEGRSAIVLYRFYPEENRIEEQAYIPMDEPYQILKEDLDSFVYLSTQSVFYFSLGGNVYSYGVLTKKLETVVTNRTDENLMLSREGKYIAWQDELNPRKSKSIVLMDLETGRQSTINAPDGKNIKILGNIEQNIIFGYANNKDITESADGTTIVPLYQVDIADITGNIQKTYKRKGNYVVSVKVENNIITLVRVKKSGSSKLQYKNTTPDHIKYNIPDLAEDISVTYRVTDAALTEYYIALPSSIEIGAKPEIKKADNTVAMSDTTLHMKKEENEVFQRFYVYAKGSIAASYNSAEEAIEKADDWMGTVADNNQNIVWQRGLETSSRTITGISAVTAGGQVDSIKACLSMLLSYNKLNIPVDQLNYKESSIYGVLQEKLKSTPINMTGVDLSQILYFISKDRPVIAMKDSKNAVLIVGYDSWNISYIDPQTGKTVKKGLGDSTAMFEDAGNVFFSYAD